MNRNRLLGMIAIVAVIGLFFAGCDLDPDNETSGNGSGNGTRRVSFNVSNEQEWDAVVNIKSAGMVCKGDVYGYS